MLPHGAREILLVEDDAAIRETLAELLGDEGYRVTTAVHGAQALEALLQGLRPHLILLDLMMPVMDGWELLGHLSQIQELATIPVVVVSAARESLPDGACHYLNKPLDVATLLDTLHDFDGSLDHPGLHEQLPAATAGQRAAL